MSKKFFVLIITSIFLFTSAYKLRLKNYDTIPVKGQSVDEYSNTWVGLSLIKLGMPVGISGLGGYKENVYRYVNVDRIFQNGEAVDGSPMPLNYPWFDHPPAMGLLTGAWAYFKGANVFEDTISLVIRKPMVMLGSVSVVLLFWLMYLNYNYLTAFISALIYAIFPFGVVSSRMIQAENGLIPLSILALIFFSLYSKKEKQIWWWLMSMVSGLAILFKLSGIYIFLSIVLLLVVDYKKHKKDFVDLLLILIVVNLSFLSAFAIYGYFYDWSQFVSIIKSNTDRVYGIGFNSLINLISQSRLTMTKFLSDPYWIFGWISFFVCIKKFIKHKLLIVSLLSYLSVYLFFGSQPYGWYTFPFIPYLVAFLGNVFSSKNNLLKLVINLSIMGFYIDKLYLAQGMILGLWRFLVPLLIVAGVIFGIRKKQKRFEVLNYGYLVLNIILTLKYLSLFSVDYWYKVN